MYMKFLQIFSENRSPLSGSLTQGSRMLLGCADGEPVSYSFTGLASGSS